MRKLNFIYIMHIKREYHTKDEGKQMVQTVRIKLAVDEKNGFIILRVFEWYFVIYFMY